ncbi:hypothetical protein ACFL23_03015 [Patescibacteria group bacterium]
MPTTEDSTVWIKIRPNDGTIDADAWATSNSFGLDYIAPSSVGVPTFGTITSTSIIINKPTVATEAGSGLYQWQTRRDSATELGLTAIATTEITDSSLSENTQYTYDVQFKDTATNLGNYGTTALKYTLADTPTNLVGTVTTDSITLTVDELPNATSDSSGYYFYRNNGSPNSGWIQTNTWNDTSILCNNRYTYYVKYRNGDGTETSALSLVKDSNPCGAVVMLFTPPAPVVSEFKTVENITQNVMPESVSPESVSNINDISPVVENEAIESINARENLIVKIISEAVEFVKGKLDNILKKVGLKRNLAKEQKTVVDYVKPLVLDVKNVSNKITNSITNFISYGTETTINLRENERVGILNSYKKAYKKLPEGENDWQDVIKIANGRFPSAKSFKKEEEAIEIFTIIYKRLPDFKNNNDEATVKIMSYGIRPKDRNLNSEKFAINIFKEIYNNLPETNQDWDIVRAIAYSGATR